ncbi:MAG: HU family DNA-binding protein [Propioniciclava sp.]|uniref:HU family DNA-binding protein n=1 Tax=Propioniciclava sp. TaxID=2038686 RepID=UPI0039E409F3
MNRSELVADVAAVTELTERETEVTIAAALDVIGSALARGESVTLAGFGTFERRERAARAGRNPQTGEAMEIAAAKVPAFKAAAALKRRVAGA